MEQVEKYLEKKVLIQTEVSGNLIGLNPIFWRRGIVENRRYVFHSRNNSSFCVFSGILDVRAEAGLHAKFSLSKDGGPEKKMFFEPEEKKKDQKKS